MNKTKFFFFIQTLFLFISCSNENINTLIIDKEIKAVGNISSDTIYNGLIKFYDLKSNRLLRQCYYVNGNSNGEGIEYYDSGQIAAKIMYECGKQNGYALLYDRNGKCTSKSFFYYGLKVGNSIDYTNDTTKSYWFYSLDNEALINISYNSTFQKKKITDIVSEYFFYRKKEYANLTTSGLTEKQQEYFLYTPDPPEYNFRYSLVLLDTAYKVSSILQNFDNNKPWSTFTTLKDSSNKTLAIRLMIKDLVNGGNIIMFKKLQ